MEDVNCCCCFYTVISIYLSIYNKDTEVWTILLPVEQLEEQKKIMYKERQVKIEEATRELNNVKQEVESRKQDLQTSHRKVAAMVAEVISCLPQTRKVVELVVNAIDHCLSDACKSVLFTIG